MFYIMIGEMLCEGSQPDQTFHRKLPTLGVMLDKLIDHFDQGLGVCFLYPKILLRNMKVGELAPKIVLELTSSTMTENALLQTRIYLFLLLIFQKLTTKARSKDTLLKQRNEEETRSNPRYMALATRNALRRQKFPTT